jgi:hypothetical protein
MTASEHSEMKQTQSLCDIYNREREREREKEQKPLNRLKRMSEWTGMDIVFKFVTALADGPGANRINLIDSNW